MSMQPSATFLFENLRCPVSQSVAKKFKIDLSVKKEP